MTKEKLIMYLCRFGFTPDEAYNIAYDFKRGLQMMNTIKAYDKQLQANG